VIRNQGQSAKDLGWRKPSSQAPFAQQQAQKRSAGIRNTERAVEKVQLKKWQLWRIVHPWRSREERSLRSWRRRTVGSKLEPSNAEPQRARPAESRRLLDRSMKRCEGASRLESLSAAAAAQVQACVSTEI
jgi:hypothetical protein